MKRPVVPQIISAPKYLSTSDTPAPDNHEFLPLFFNEILEGKQNYPSHPL